MPPPPPPVLDARRVPARGAGGASGAPGGGEGLDQSPRRTGRRSQAVWVQVREQSAIQTASWRPGVHTVDVSRKRQERLSCRPGPEPPGMTQVLMEVWESEALPVGTASLMRVRVALPLGDTHVTMSHGPPPRRTWDPEGGRPQSNTGHETGVRPCSGTSRAPFLYPDFRPQAGVHAGGPRDRPTPCTSREGTELSPARG